VDAQVESPLDELLHIVKEDLADKRNWARDKYWNAAKGALDQMASSDNPVRQERASQAAHAVGAQAAAEGSQLKRAGQSAQDVTVMEAHVAISKGSQKVTKQVAQVGQQVQQTQGLSQAVSVLEGRMQSTEQVGRNIQGSLQLINENVRGINALDETSLKGGVQKISAEIAAIKANLKLG